MRVTQSSMLRSYMRNLHRNAANKEASNEKLNSLRSFSRVSESPSDAAKAFTIREQLYKNEQYTVNVRDAKSELTTAEGSLMAVTDIMKSLKERIVQGTTGTYSQAQRDIIAGEVENLAEQVIQFANSKFGAKFLFSGSGNDEAPFTIDEVTKKLLYHGVSVDNPPATGFPQNKDVFIDVGMGLKIEGGEVDKKSALRLSTSGVDAYGSGTTNIEGEEVPNNVYSYMMKVAKELRSGDKEALDKTHKHFEKVQDNLMISITDIGTRYTFLEKNEDRLKIEAIRLQEVQKKVEGVDIEGESINMKTYEMAWNITLMMGSKLIPPSIFDFMR